MRIINAQPKHSTIFWVTTRLSRGDWRATLIVKAGYRLLPGGIAVPDEAAAPAASGDDPAEPGKPPAYSTDFVPYKPTADFLVAGPAHAPGGKPAARCRVSIGIGSQTKSLLAIGDRRWQHGLGVSRPGEPAPFVSLPIGYDAAFGGEGFRRNPLGRGAAVRGAGALPNIEWPDQLIASPADSPEPAGFGPLPMSWEPRIGKTGTYDQTWLKTRWPGLPADFDWSHFNAAPSGQQFKHFQGDEALAFENLHPVHPIYKSRLPGVRARVFVKRVAEDQESLEEVPANLDTVWAHVTEERLVLVWRGVTKIGSPRLREIAAIYSTLEPIDSAQAQEEHLKTFAELARPPESAEAMAAAHHARIAEIRETVETKVQQARALIETLTQTGAAYQKASGIDKIRARMPPGPEDPMAALESAIAELKSRDPEKAAQLGQALETAEISLGKVLAMVAARKPLTQDSVATALMQGDGLAGAKLDGLDLSGMDFTGADLHDATLTGAKLRGSRLDGANLSGADFSKSDLTDASFVKADLSCANFTDANAKGASFAGARIDNAVFTKLNLSGGDFNGADGNAADFSDAVLDDAYFVGAVLPNARFTAVCAAAADFSRAVLREANFAAAKAPGIIMENADLTNLRAARGADFSGGRFARAIAPRSVWQQALLDGADFSRAVLTEALFPEASLRDANLDRAHLQTASFDDALLTNAALTNANLLRASFERADLTQARLDGSNAYGAGFLDANLEEATFQGCFLARTRLA